MALKQGFTLPNTLILALLTLSYIVGETSKFLLGVVSREMSRDLEYGDLKCYEDEEYPGTSNDELTETCGSLDTETRWDILLEYIVKDIGS